MDAHQILFVEDDFLVSEAACSFLRDQGFRVVQADTAAAAAIVVGRLPYFSGLVTDIDLGAGVDGFEVARRMRAAYPGLPVVFVTGTASARHLSEGVEGSILICKPYHPRQIAEALCSLAPHQCAA